VDGTKIHANGSKHSAVSYKRVAEMIEEAEGEVEELIQKAEAADSVPLKEGLTIPEEINNLVLKSEVVVLIRWLHSGV
jgi:uncharacterized protein YfcZ (UPF0381/DUF406 family)